MAERDARESRRLDAQLLSDLWIFRAAARSESMSVAASQLHVTAGAVSQRVQRLEARLGVSLFVRQKSRVVLTEAGSVLLETMNGVSAALNEALARVDRSERVSVVVSCGGSLVTEWLLPNLRDFYQECPDIELQVRAETIVPTAARMADESIDVAVSYLHQRPGDVVELASIQELTFPVCSRDYRERLESRPAQEREVAVMHDADAWREGEAPRAEWMEWLAGSGAVSSFIVKSERQFNMAHLAYQAASYGQGIAIGRSLSVHGMLKSGRLVSALDLPPVPSASYRLLARSEPASDTPIARFAAWMAAALERTQQETLHLIGR